MKLKLLDEYLDFFEGNLFSSYREFTKSLNLSFLDDDFVNLLNDYISSCPSIKSLEEVELGPLDVIFLGYIDYLDDPQTFYPLYKDQIYFNLLWSKHLENRKSKYSFDIEIIEKFSSIKYQEELYNIFLLVLPEQNDYSFVCLCKESDIYTKKENERI